MVSPISHWVITQLPDASFLLALILKWLRLLFGSRGVPPILQTSPNHREPVLTSTPSPGPTTYSWGRPTVNSKRPAESMNQAEGVRPKISHEEGRWTSSSVTTACPTTTFLKRKRVGFYDLGESVGPPPPPPLKHWQREQFLSPTLAPFSWGMRLTLILQITSTIKLFKTLYPGKIVNNSMLVLR